MLIDDGTGVKETVKNRLKVMSCDEKKRLSVIEIVRPGVYKYSFRCSIVRVMIGSGYG